MKRNFLPITDAALLAWTSNFSSLLQIDPLSYGVPLTASEAYATKQALYATSLSAATDPKTRGGSTVFAKDAARKDLVDYTRLLARTVQGAIGVTDQ